MDLRRTSIGLPGNLPAATLRELAPRIESAGFHALWLNDTPDGDSLAGLVAAAEVTVTLRLGCGVIPVDRRDAVQIAGALGDLPANRLTIGIGSGGPRDAIARVGTAIDTLRGATAAPILVGALGPRMRRLAAQQADGVLLNWLTQRAAREAAEQLRLDAEGRPCRSVLYARTIMDAQARPALTAESARYDSYPSYAANLKRIDARAIDATIDGSSLGSLAASADGYLESVHELVLRAIVAQPTVDDYLRFIEAAAVA